MEVRARVFLDAIALTLIVAGLLWLAATLGLPYQSFAESGYLGGVLSRSFGNLYQGALLCGLLAMPLHAIISLRKREAAAPAYDLFTVWGQTLFTSLGFLGTIIGVSLAVGGLEAAMAEGDPAGLIAGLSTAFDTTFIGLSASVLLMIFRTISQLGRAAEAP